MSRVHHMLSAFELNVGWPSIDRWPALLGMALLAAVLVTILVMWRFPHFWV